MKIVLVQLDVAWEDPAANFSRVTALLEKSPPQPGSLIVLPETFATGFTLSTEASRPTDSPSASEVFLRETALRHRSTVVGGVIGYSEENPAALANQAVVFGPDGARLACYQKQRPFSLIGEPAWYPPGTRSVTFQHAGFQIAPLICYDLRFPELFRGPAVAGATAFVVIAQWPVKRQEHWIVLLKARAIENQAFVIGVNRCGRDPEFSYSGRSMVVNPHGIVIADAGETERVLTAEIDPAEAEAWRRDFPALRDAGWAPGV